MHNLRHKCPRTVGELAWLWPMDQPNSRGIVDIGQVLCQVSHQWVSSRTGLGLDILSQVV